MIENRFELSCAPRFGNSPFGQSMPLIVVGAKSAGGCELRPILKQALDAWFAVLDRYSLADVVRRKTVLVQLLGWEVA